MTQSAKSNVQSLNSTFVIVILLLLVAAYFLPWTWHKDAALSPGAYDLAEWTTLNPTSRNTTPPLSASLYLRVSLGLVAGLWALHREHFPKRLRWLPVIFGLWVVFYLLPPPDFFTGAGNDANYRQQFTISIVTALLVTSCWFVPMLSMFVQHMVKVLLCGVSILVAVAGLNGGMALMTMFNIGHGVGIGPILFVLGMVMLVTTSLWSWKQKYASNFSVTRV